MIFKAQHALDERLEYSQMAPNRWRATYRGFVTLSAEGRDPRDAQYNVEEAFDLLLANLIRTSHRPLKTDSDVVTQADEGTPFENEGRATESPRNAVDDRDRPRPRRHDNTSKTLSFKQR